MRLFSEKRMGHLRKILKSAMPKTFLNIFILGLTLLSTYFFVRSVLLLTILDVSHLSLACEGYSDTLLYNLSSQKADYMVAIIMLIFSFVLQVINNLLPGVLLAVNKKAVLCALIITLACFFLAESLSTLIKKDFYNKSKNYLNILKH